MSPSELKALRKGAKLTQRELADAIGMWPGAIGEMERGEKPIEKRTWLAVLYVLRQREVVTFDQPVPDATRWEPPTAVVGERLDGGTPSDIMRMIGQNDWPDGYYSMGHGAPARLVHPISPRVHGLFAKGGGAA